MIVYLVGMPGSGKSTVGREVAGRLGVPFVDLDEEIERRHGSTVPEIFADEGEAAFRALEARELVEVSRQDPSVVACGGGVVLEPANRIALRNTGTCVYLERAGRSPRRPPGALSGECWRILSPRTEP